MVAIECRDFQRVNLTEYMYNRIDQWQVHNRWFSTIPGRKEIIFEPEEIENYSKLVSQKHNQPHTSTSILPSCLKENCRCLQRCTNGVDIVFKGKSCF